MSVTSLMAVLGNEDYLVSLQARDHEILADEPTKLGGQDQGLSPFELILAGLGACTAITLKMYAQRKGWVLEDIDVQLQLTVVATHVPVITRQIRIQGPITGEQHDRLLEIANTCPVHRLLTNPLEIETELTT